MYTVLIRIDELGEWPFFVDETQQVPVHPGARYRYVARVAGREAALARVVALALGRTQAETAEPDPGPPLEV